MGMVAIRRLYPHPTGLMAATKAFQEATDDTLTRNHAFPQQLRQNTPIAVAGPAHHDIFHGGNQRRFILALGA